MKSQTTAILVCSLILLSGCSGLDSGGLEIVAQDADKTLAGNVEITVTVENTADERQTGEVFCEVEVGGEIYETSKAVAVPGNSRKAYELSIDLPFDEYAEGGTYRCSIES